MNDNLFESVNLVLEELESTKEAIKKKLEDNQNTDILNGQLWGINYAINELRRAIRSE